MDRALAWLPLLGLCVFFLLNTTTTFGQKAPTATHYGPWGGAFTPRGDLKVLLVFVRFTDKTAQNPSFVNAGQPLDQWSDVPQQRGLPDYVDPLTGDCPSFIYNRAEDFDRYQNDPRNTSISRVWHYNSLPLGQFRIFGESFRDAQGRPTAIEVDPVGCSTWGHVNKKVVEQMRALHPDFDFRAFDRRRNGPNFRFDNSDTTQSRPDGTVDYTIFIYRYDPGWAQQPAPGIARWPGSDGGFASLGPVDMLDPFEDGTQLKEGFTLCKGAGIPTALLIHEIAHTLYNCPHFQSSNGTVGDYFYPVSAGASATSPVPNFRTFSAWERWYLGYSEPVADVRLPLDSLVGKWYRLRDFLTTGDALRIPMPHSNGNPALWIEYHQKRINLDEHPWAGQHIGPDDNTLPPTPAGVYVTWERVSASRNQAVDFAQGNNGLRPISASGNWDYTRQDSFITNRWGNVLYLYSRGAPNPTGGTNPLTSFRDDFNGDGSIAVSTHPNMAVNEGRDFSIAYEAVRPGHYEPLYANLGCYSAKALGYARPHAFVDGDSVTLSTNPLILEMPKYSVRDTGFQSARLCGLSLFFRQDSDGDFWVKIKDKQTAIYGDIRWSGRLVLPDITGDTQPDLLLSRKSKLRLVKGVVPNRHAKTPAGDFVNPTVFTVASGASIRLETGSRLIIESGASLVFEPNAFLFLGKKAKIKVEKGGSLIFLEEKGK